MGSLFFLIGDFPTKTRVKPPNHLTHARSIRSAWRSSFPNLLYWIYRSKKAPAKSRGFPLNTHKPFRKTILPVTPLDGRFYRHQKSYVAESKDFIQGYPPGGYPSKGEFMQYPMPPYGIHQPLPAPQSARIACYTMALPCQSSSSKRPAPPMTSPS